MVDYLGVDNCGFNFQGKTSLGKTIALALAVSAWAVPSVRKDTSGNGGLMFGANTTANGIEVIAQRSTGTICAIDELSMLKPDDVHRLVFGFKGGTGKLRLDQKADARALRSWRSAMFTTSEKSIEQMIRGADDRGEWTAGAAVRHLDLAFDDTNAAKVSEADLASIRQQMRANYGHAGPTFSEALMRIDRAQLVEMVDSFAQGMGSAEVSAVEIRTREVFALLKLTGAIAVRLDLLPAAIDVNGTIDAAYRLFLETNDTLLDPYEQAADNIRTAIDRKWGLTIVPCTASSNLKEPEGWFDEIGIYIPRKLLGSFADSKELDGPKIAKYLREKGMLVEHMLAYDKKLAYDPKLKGSRANFTRRVPLHSGVTCYPLKRSLFSPSSGAAGEADLLRATLRTAREREAEQRKSMGDDAYDRVVADLEREIAAAETRAEATRESGHDDV
jgi:hypothetical protein